MKRKLIKHGDSSLTIALPKSWVDSLHLKKGQEVDVEVVKGGLTIKANSSKNEEEIELDVSGKGKVIMKILGAAYKSGYDRARIIYSSAQELNLIHDVLAHHFIGFQIVSQSKNMLFVKNITGNDFDDFDVVLRRFFHILNNTGEEICEAFKKKDIDWLKQISLNKSETDKLSDILKRSLNKGKVPDKFKRIPPLYAVFEEVQKIANGYSDVAKFLSENSNLEKSTALLKITQDVTKYVRFMSDLFFEFNLEKIEKLIETADKLNDSIADEFNSSNATTRKYLILMDRLVGLTIYLNGPIMSSYL